MDSELFQKNRILITTSRNPSHFLRRTTRVLNYSLLGSFRKNRGSYNLNQLFSYCWNNAIPRLYIIEGEKKEKIVRIKVYKVKDKIELTSLRITMDNILNLERHKANTRININRIEIKPVDVPDELMDYILKELYLSNFSITSKQNQHKTLYLDFKLLTNNIILCKARVFRNDIDQFLFQLTIHLINQE